jgi:hypothetical protein
MWNVFEIHINIPIAFQIQHPYEPKILMQNMFIRTKDINVKCVSTPY